MEGYSVENEVPEALRFEVFFYAGFGDFEKPVAEEFEGVDADLFVGTGEEFEGWEGGF